MTINEEDREELIDAIYRLIFNGENWHSMFDNLGFTQDEINFLCKSVNVWKDKVNNPKLGLS